MSARLMAAELSVLLATGLAGCRDQPPGRSSASPPPAVAPGPVNPDVRVVDYTCADGQRITAGYPDRETAIVTYKGHAYTLKQAASASGARYTGYGLQWWEKGPQASIAALKPGEDIAPPGVDCTADTPRS
jgi:membrane-bound inhibitor of C-type lysozyme